MKKLSSTVMALGLAWLAVACAVDDPEEGSASAEPARQELAAPVKGSPAPAASLVVEYCEDVNGTSCLGSGSRSCFLKYDGVWSSCLCRSRTWVCAL